MLRLTDVNGKLLPLSQCNVNINAAFTAHLHIRAGS